ncbi:MAG: hypothetical protein Q8P34_16110 [Bacteroidota bacterium]|nr:hypothetical protein [Bacteroidota bacterium]
MKDLLFKAFYQGRDQESLGAGNCASLGLIKAAIFTFGFDVISYKKEDDTYRVILKNGDKISFTESELNYAKKESSFILGEYKSSDEEEQFSEILNYAHLCFASICKMAQINGDYSSRYSKFIIPENFEMAVEIINDGTFTPNVYELLGLEDYVTPTYRTKLTHKINESYGMLLWTGVHAMYANNGNFDLYGKKEKFTGRIMLKLPGKIAAGIFQIKS